MKNCDSLSIDPPQSAGSGTPNRHSMITNSSMIQRPETSKQPLIYIHTAPPLQPSCTTELPKPASPSPSAVRTRHQAIYVVRISVDTRSLSTRVVSMLKSTLLPEQSNETVQVSFVVPPSLLFCPVTMLHKAAAAICQRPSKHFIIAPSETSKQ
ncbi:hypothetical protein M378DRAFT_336338 [Amanita muscaria Koide BX008]|uniref:Uncharacterized protein n=1 Tax=Amanita muscaria (strain Koide BX008) TaxID=946122 RepID=A0A0C2WAG2_AMAMK|nr:hypothetical protein M378DRAFT_336338 [Amanita muscaria Koide BX008]